MRINGHLCLIASAVCVAWTPVAASAAEPSDTTPTSTCDTENLLKGKSPSHAEGVQGPTSLLTDGTVPPEGAVWDVPAAVILANEGASLTYDLGSVRQVGAIYVQGDANDTYRLSGSADGAPGTFHFLGEVRNVVDQGPGLRSRALQLVPAEVRFLRIGDGQGDSFYSLSEFAAYCHAPTPFPPALPVVQAALAQAGSSDRARVIPPPAPADNVQTFLLLLGAVFAAIGLVTWRRQRAEGAANATGQDAVEAAATRASAWTHNRLRLIFVGSGCAALIYEVVWLHLLRLVIGASALSVGIVLASFMGGMFLGSLFFARIVPRDRDPLKVYAFLEIGIGVFGLLMPLILPAVKYIYVGLVGYGSLGIALRALIAAILLLPPTALMGATLPAIARRYAHGRQGMADLASLYAANTAGAVAGCLLSGFYLLAEWDVWVATFVAAVLNFLVGAGSLRLGRRAAAERSSAQATAPAVDVAQPLSRQAQAVLVAVGLSGMTALAAQVVWTRLLTLLFGATVYAFSIILAVFLAGLGIGSAAAARWLRQGAHAARALAWSQLGLVPAALIAAYLLADVLPFASPPASTPIRALHALHVLRALAVVLPGALLWGMSFPFALAAAAPVQGDTGRSSGHVYAANTLGAIVGALAVSFWSIPYLGTRWSEQALVVTAGVSAAALFYALRKQAADAAGENAVSRPTMPAWSLALAFAAAAVLPGPSTVFLAHGRYIWWVTPQDQYPYVSEGAASTVAVHIGADGYRNFHVSGRVEASNNPNDMRLQRMLGHLSALAHPHPESVLVVGMGAGTTAGALAQHPEVKRVVICEIEPRVTGATNEFAAENYGVLKDPKVQIVFDDARHFLATTHERFDIITSDPIHPWVRGNSVLFSREYYAVVRSKLKPGGIATQWVPLYETSEEAIQIQMKTFMDAFPDGTVWNSAANGKGYDVVLLGRNEPLHMDLAQIQARLDRSPAIAQSLREVKMGSALDLLATYSTRASDMTAWYAHTPLNRDFSLKLEYISGLALNANHADVIFAHMVEGHTYPAEILTAPPPFDAELRRRILGNKPSGRE